MLLSHASVNMHELLHVPHVCCLSCCCTDARHSVLCLFCVSFQVVWLNALWLYPDTIICSASFLHRPPPPQSSASSPPPQPVAYLYPGDSKEPIKALQTSSARHSSVHKSNHTMSLWSPATLPPLQRRQINTTKASTAGNYNCIGLQMTNRRWYSTLARTIWDFFDAGCTWIHSLEDQKYEKHCICLLTRFFKCLCDVDKDWKNPLHVWHEWR